MKPIVWSIAGSDSSGGAGVQADLKTIQALGGHGTSITTALTAQNTCRVEAIQEISVEMFSAQWDALEKDLPASAVKIGMIGSPTLAMALAKKLETLSAPIVLDPVLIASSGDSLSSSGGLELLRKRLLPLATLITPNIPEAEAITGIRVRSEEEIRKAATILLGMGPRAVLIKGGHGSGPDATDIYFDKDQAIEVSSPRQEREAHGTGCALSSAIATGLARGHSLPNAIVNAKTFVTQALRTSEKLGAGSPLLDFSNNPSLVCADDFPVSRPSHLALPPVTFPRVEDDLGFYLIVDSLERLKDAINWGVKTIQFRKKAASEDEVARAVWLARNAKIKLFINDYWQWAVDHKAYGVHLGQSDLSSADLKKISAAGLRLGISTHDLYELSIAKAIQPSYLAIGTVFPTTLKKMPYSLVGVERLSLWRKYCDVPVVAIGGICFERAIPVLSTGIDSIAVVSDVLQNTDPQKRAINWLNTFNNHRVTKHVPTI